MTRRKIHQFLLPGLCFIFWGGLNLKAQASFSAGSYFQDFGTANIAAWTDNSTFPGWYLGTGSSGTFQGTINITAAAPSNGGGLYMYTCNGVADLKLGTRPSNAPAGGPCDATPASCGFGLGLRMINNFGLPIVSIKIDFDWYQLSLAQNGGAVNSMLFYYKTGPGPLTSVSNTVSTGTHVAALDWTCPQSSAVSGSGQINGYPCTQSGHVSSCIVVSVPVNNELFFAWWDPNNSNNDPHLAIDNISITAYSDNVCATVLPVDLLSFSAMPVNNKSVDLRWATSSETNNDFFTVERSVNGDPFQPVAHVNGSGTTTQQHYYGLYDNEPGAGINYYRLSQTDYNGNNTICSIRAVNFQQNGTFSPLFFVTDEGLSYTVQSEEPFEISVTDISGRIIYEQKDMMSASGKIKTDEWAHGIYLVRCTNRWKTHFQKIVL